MLLISVPDLSAFSMSLKNLNARFETKHEVRLDVNQPASKFK